MKFIFSNSALYFVKTLGAFILVFVAFNYTWRYAQQREGNTTVPQSGTATNNINSAVRLQERNGQKLVLSWTMDPAKKLSHFVLERSVDGRIYNEAALVFTGEEDNTGKYDYSEKIKRAGAGPVYYRLKAVDMEGKYTYAPVAATLSDIPTGDQLTAQQIK